MLRNRIADQRAQCGRGISKADLARAIGVSRSYVTKLESGQARPSVDVMFRLAAYFGCRVDDIFEYERQGAAG